jgi:PEP-CTERM motif
VLINETVEATSNSTVLSFQGFDVPNSIGLDDVSVSTASSVPEPSTFALLGTGILGLASVARRKFSS